MSVWYRVLEEIQDVLIQNKVARIVEMGALNPNDFDFTLSKKSQLKDGIFIYRDREYNENVQNMHNSKEGTVTVYLECWVRNDNPNPRCGYKDLSELEDKVEKVLRQYVLDRVNDEDSSFALLDIESLETIGDADSKRPLVGSRKNLKISYAKK